MTAEPASNTFQSRPTTFIGPGDTPWSEYLREMWTYRELLYFLVWRDFVVRYKQTRAGIGWAVLQPLLGLAVYWWAFGVVAKVPSGELPYPLFIFSGLIPFTFVSEYLCRAVDAVTGSKDLISKVYFPRAFPVLSALIISLVDFLIMIGIMGVLMAFYRYAPPTSIVFLPIIVVLAAFLALGAGLFLAAANVRHRDASRLTGLFVRFLFFASPVFYSRTMVPSGMVDAYDLNPMSAIIGGFRWSLLASGRPGAQTVLEAVVVTAIVLVAGLEFFRRVDKNIADTI